MRGCSMTSGRRTPTRNGRRRGRHGKQARRTAMRKRAVRHIVMAIEVTVCVEQGDQPAEDIEDAVYDDMHGVVKHMELGGLIGKQMVTHFTEEPLVRLMGIR